ncbi:MAG TPA: MFS transporter [Capsulimonadaceae bacterium]
MTKKLYTAPNSQIYAWATGAFASHFLIQTFLQAGVIFTVGFGLSPVVIGWAMMVPRFVDALVDPYLGHRSDETHTRWGRRKPYLVVGSVLGAIFMAAMWWASPSWSQTAQLAYLTIVGTLFFICYGLYTMAWTAVGYELTDEYHERSRVMAAAAFAIAIVNLCAAWCFRAALMPIFGGAVSGMRWISAGVAVVVVATAFVATKYCKERFTQSNRVHVPLGTAIKTAMTNKPFVILLLIKLSDTLGGRVGGTLMGYLGLYMLCNGDKVLSTTLTGIGGTIGTVLSFAMVPFVKPLSVRLGKRAALIAGSAVGLIAALMSPIILTSGHPYWSLIPTIFIAPLSTLAFTISSAIVPDICDMDELKTGQRREGLFTSVMAFMAKMEISLCTLVSGYLVSFAGVNVKLVNQAPHVVHKLFLIGLVPTILFALTSFLLTLKFSMTEAQMDDVRGQLDARHKLRLETEGGNEIYGVNGDEGPDGELGQGMIAEGERAMTAAASK